ncbi:MAG: phage major tail tube protein [Firmicutes bacterium]|nr:phage major tail tube protein [Bacillota bacterium]
MDQIEGTLAAAIYEDGKQYLGLASVKMPDIEYGTFTLSGLGLCGEAEYGALCQFKPMKMTLNFSETSEAFHLLSEQRMHMITIDVCKQTHDYSGRQLHTTGVKHVLQVQPLKKEGGTIAPASQQNVAVEFSVFMHKEMIDEKVVRHIDVINYINVGYDGVDIAEPIRKALGMA